jgi:hypothetical protein
MSVRAESDREIDGSDSNDYLDQGDQFPETTRRGCNHRQTNIHL